MLGNGLGPWRSRFIYNLNTQLLNKIIFPFRSLHQNEYAITSTLRDAVQTMWQGRMKVPCVNGDAEKIRSANYETVLKWRIFFLFRPLLFFTLPTFGAQIN